MQTIRILLVDDFLPTREQMKILLHSEPDITVVATAASAEEALDIEKELHPDVVVMDIMLPGMNGIEATRRILTRRPEAKVLALSNHSGPALVQAVFEAGGLGYVRKNCADQDLIPAIQSVGAGKKYSRTAAH